MTRFGVTLLLVGVLIVGLGGAAYLLPFVVSFDEAGGAVFETAVLVCWGLGAALLLAGAAAVGFGKLTSRA